MGFCRHCGDIVAGVRCQCGGTAVAPVIAWNRADSSSNAQDRWTKTYVSPQRSTSPVRQLECKPNISSGVTASTSVNVPPTVTTRRFPRPKSTSSANLPLLKMGVSDHITLATSQSPRPPSPLKISTTMSDAGSDILPSFLPHEPTLSKVYGSVLQSKDTLTLHSCAICSAVFPPDATIYPNLSASSPDPNSFLCRPCFTANGGSKGTCPSCSRPVLALKAEGGFVHASSRYWHKRCFSCAGCFKNIGDAPMVDLLGRPSCAECFDNCLKRDPSTPKKGRTSNNNSPILSNPGGLNASYGRKSRESSPAIEELEQRLGIARSRESSPALNRSARRISLNMGNGLTVSQSNSSPSRPSSLHAESPKLRRYVASDETSPTRPQNSQSLSTGCLVPESPTRNERIATLSNVLTPDSPLKRSTSYTSFQQSRHATLEKSVHVPGSQSEADSHHIIQIPSTDISSFLSSLNVSSGSSAMAKSAKFNNVQTIPGAVVSSSPITISSSSLCWKCNQAVLNPRQGGQFVTIPGGDENAIPQIYHTDCFKCGVCDNAFNDVKKGQLSFVQSTFGPCHVQCAPAEQFVIRRPLSTKSLQISAPVTIESSETRPLGSKKSNTSMPPPSSRFEQPLAPPHSPPKISLPRFGGQATCPGCQRPVSPMERGVVPGPQGTRWHASCLICGGKKEMTAARLLGRGREERKKGEPGCGKKLDSAAKSDGEGGVWCRECLLLLGVGGSPQASPTRSPLIPSFTGTSNKILPQFTGTTTIARQFTGVGGSDAILRQLTGGGLSPTRSISPTKQLGIMGPGGSMRPRPKSLIGMRSSKSIDEGRGMYLVRQLTGATNGWES